MAGMTAEQLLRREGAEAITARATREVVLLADDAAMSITWSRYGAGERGPDLHVHREHLDAFYVLEGELTFAVGPAGERLRVGPGGFVAVPPDVAHGFANESAADACWLNFHAPDKGFAQYLRDARDGRSGAFDSFDPPPDGGLPADGIVVSRAGEGDALTVAGVPVLVRAVLPALAVAEWTQAPPDPRPGDRHWALDGRRVLSLGAVGPAAA
jgi:quercetin dioxygenase-like cupin family protein